MALDSDLIERGKELLTRAVKDPFDQVHPHSPEQDTHVRDWFEFLIRHFPLWSLNKRAWRSAEWPPEDGVPSFAPTSIWLQATVESLLRDDGVFPVEESNHVGRQIWDRNKLRAAINSRRGALIRGETPFVGAVFFERDSKIQVPASSEDPIRFTDLLWYEDGPPEESPAFDLGIQSNALREAILRAKNSAERELAKADLGVFLEEIGGKATRGGPGIGPQSPLLKELFKEGKDFFETAWAVFAIHPSLKARDILRTLPDEAEPHPQLSAVRLALPILSLPEVEVLLRGSQAWAGKRSSSGALTPRRFTVWVLSHRYETLAATTADNVGIKSDADYFRWEQNPIEDPSF